MSRYLIKRLLLMIPVLFGITVINFAIYSMAPGDPISVMLDPAIFEGGAARPTEEFVREAKERHGLNDPWPVQYLRWLSSVVQGDLGSSFVTGQPVSDTIVRHLWPTIELNVVALVLSTLIGIGGGLIQALRQYSKTDYTLSFLAFFNVSMPGFFLGLILIYVFSLRLGWLPAAGRQTLGVPFSWGDHLAHLILPALTLGLGGAGLMRVTRTSMLEVMRRPYVTTARAKGLREQTVIMRHAFRNGLIPVVTLLGGEIPALIGGAFIVENVFNWPGMGVLAVQSVGNRDYPVIMALVLIASCLSIFAMLITDLVYTLVDPRIRYG